MIAGNVKEQANLPIPEEQLKQFLQLGDRSAGDGDIKQRDANSNVIQRYCAINSKWYEAWNAYVKEPTKFSPPTRPFFHAPLAGIGGQLKFDVEERIHYEIVTEEQFDLFDQWYNASQNGENTECKKALPNPVISRKHKADRRQTKLLDINFSLTGKLNGAHAVLIYISLILKFSCKKNITVFFTIKSLVQTCR